MYRRRLFYACDFFLFVRLEINKMMEILLLLSIVRNLLKAKSVFLNQKTTFYLKRQISVGPMIRARPATAGAISCLLWWMNCLLVDHH
jgi:hypothetical protein